MHKKITASILLIAMLSFIVIVMAACTNNGKESEVESALHDKVHAKFTAYHTDLTDTKSSVRTNGDLQEFLEGWSKAKGLTSETDSAGNVILSIKSSKEYQEAPPTVLICSYDAKQLANSINTLATALYVAKNNEHTGKLTVIFTQERGHDFSGVQALDGKYFTDDTNVIVLNESAQALFATKTAASSVYEFKRSISRTAPTQDKAYRIEIKGLPGGQPDGKISENVNPITKLNSLLASLKNKRILFELASCEGGSSDYLYPTSAAMTIVIDADKEEAFCSKMDEEIEKWNKMYKEEENPPTYTYEKTSMPKSVLTSSDCNRIVSFLYTLLNGKYYENEEDQLISIASISTIKVKGDRIRIGATATSLDSGNLKTLDTDEETLCSLSSFHYKKIDKIPLWEGSTDSPLVTAIEEAYGKTTDKKLTFTDSLAPTIANFVAKKNSKCSMISITTSENIAENCTETILRYLLASNQEQES